MAGPAVKPSDKHILGPAPISCWVESSVATKCASAPAPRRRRPRSGDYSLTASALNFCREAEVVDLSHELVMERVTGMARTQGFYLLY